jgi:hypothetical protein
MMKIIYERVAAIDVGKKVIAVAVRIPGERVGRRRCGSTDPDLE